MSTHGKLPFNPIIWPAVPVDQTGQNNLAYYTTETTQRYAWGTRGMTWDGKVFRYSRSKDTLYAGFGALNGSSIDVSDLINSNHTKTIAVGDRSVLVTVAAGEGYDNGAIAEDELVGGMLAVGHGSSTTTEHRTVIGNDSVVAGGGVINVYVDYPFAIEHTTGFMELPLNPYGYLLKPSNTIGSVVGVPIITATTGQNLWIQTWGACWLSPGGSDTTPGDAYENRMLYFVGDGSVNGGNIPTIESGFQIAGFIMDATESGTGTMPYAMLQISI